MTAKLEWESNRAGVRGLGHIIDEVVEAERDGKKLTAANPLGGRRKLWRVTLGRAWSLSMAVDLAVNYDVHAVAALKYGVSQAATRLMLTHKPGTKIKVDTVLDQLCITKQQSRWNAKRRLHLDVEKLRVCGVAFNNETLVRHE